MARLSQTSPENSYSSDSRSSKRIAIGFFASVSTIIASCAKQASRVSKKFLTTTTKPSNWMSSPARSPPSKLLSSLMSNKAILFRNKQKVEKERLTENGFDAEFGDGGVWQRSIMMGDKCQPLDFSGVIYYDSCGKQVSDLPLRSPRASPLPGYAYKTAK